jgi:hypothetical protein
MKTSMAIGEGSILKQSDSQSGENVRLAGTSGIDRMGICPVPEGRQGCADEARIAFRSQVIS